jgi:hypothetical protein
VVRKAYLYLALFAGVIGGMSAAVALVFQLLRAALTGQTDSTFLATNLNDLQLLVLFSILLLYHLNVLRRDGQFTADTLAKKQSEFNVLVVDGGDGFADTVKAAIARSAPNIPITVAAKRSEGAFKAMILNGSTAVDAPDWVHSFSGSRIIVPNDSQELFWAGGVSKDAVKEAVQIARQLAEGQEVRKQSGANSSWMIIVYAAAALFGLELLLGITVMVFSSFGH